LPLPMICNGCVETDLNQAGTGRLSDVATNRVARKKKVSVQKTL